MSSVNISVQFIRNAIQAHNALMAKCMNIIITPTTVPEPIEIPESPEAVETPQSPEPEGVHDEIIIPDTLNMEEENVGPENPDFDDIEAKLEKYELILLPTVGQTKRQNQQYKRQKTENEDINLVKVPPGPQFACTECDKKFYRHNILEQHMVYMHFKGGKYVCSNCNKSFVKQVQRTIHMRTCTGCLCPVCNLPFINKLTMSVHLKTHKITEICCKFCSKTFTSTAALNAHININHVAKFGCMECGELFANNEDLQRHIDLSCSKMAEIAPHVAEEEITIEEYYPTDKVEYDSDVEVVTGE